MIDPEGGGPHTAHTTNPVPLVVVDPAGDQPLRDGGALCDVGPTILSMMGLEQPAEMTGRDLRLRRTDWRICEGLDYRSADRDRSELGERTSWISTGQESVPGSRLQPRLEFLCGPCSTAQPDPAGVAPREGPMVGGKWQMHLSGPIYFGVRLAGGSIERTIIDPTKVIEERVVGTERCRWCLPTRTSK